MAFAFKPDYAELAPESAREIIAFNAAVAGVASDAVPSLVDADALAKANDELITTIEANNEDANEAERAVVQQQLMGYQYDSAFALLIKRLIPVGLRGFMLAAILGAVMSSLASMLNAASTIFTMDLYKKYLLKDASQGNLVLVGRICVGVFVVIGCLISPLLGDPKFGGVFKYIQEFQGYISPGILAVFVFGLIAHRAPPICGVLGLLLNPVIYFLLDVVFPSLAFLDRMAISFGLLLSLMTVITLIRPLPERKKLPVRTSIDLEPSRGAKIFGIFVVIVTLGLYAYFW
jgi:SSS family solute:Na+ symporter